MKYRDTSVFQRVEGTNTLIRQLDACEIAKKFIKNKLTDEEIEIAIGKIYPTFVLSDGYVGDMRKAVRDWTTYYKTGKMPI